jgi:prepilin-type N-terminal cleavage/methylation domain-containing protein
MHRVSRLNIILAMKSRRRGFTLLELLVVITVLGLLAAIAVPRFNHMKEKANVATMQTALKNLGQAEESFFAEHGEYTALLDSLNFTPSAEMTLTVLEATNTGWSATITHPLAVPKKCAFFLGTAAAVPPARDQGALACE